MIRPPAAGAAPRLPELERLVAVMALLRAPGGCPWDAEQTHESLVRYLIEEAAELAEAIETADVAGMREELGDVLYQVLFHADLAAATAGEGFTLEDVARDTADKMIGRHPHVFGAAAAADAEAVVGLWEVQKAREKSRSSVLDGIPAGMPSLLLAEKVLGRADKVGVAVPPAAVPADEAALGAQLLALVAGARAAGLDAERALRTALRGLQADVRAAEQRPNDGDPADRRSGTGR